MSLENIENKYGIYKLVSKTTGNFYIGYTGKTFASRFENHRSGFRNRHLNKNIREHCLKYGADDFEMEILEDLTGCDILTLRKTELKYILDAFDSEHYFKCYNSNPYIKHAKTLKTRDNIIKFGCKTSKTRAEATKKIKYEKDPDVNGYIEFSNQIYKINKRSDIVKLLKIINEKTNIKHD